MVEILAVNSSEATLYFKVLTWKTWLSLLFMIDVLSFFMADSSVDSIALEDISALFRVLPDEHHLMIILGYVRKC